MDPKKIVGLTSAVNEPPTADIDIQAMISLNEALAKEQAFFTEKEIAQRQDALLMLDDLVNTWIRDTSLGKNISQFTTDNIKGFMCTFGSYRLGIDHKGADINAIIIAPKHITRDDYFSTFYNTLKENPTISHLRIDKDAFVPVIKLIVQGIEFDLLFANLELDEVPHYIGLQNDGLLRFLNPECARSINGCRVTNMISRLVPNQESFIQTLIAIKLWAKRKRIYSNALGYLGGVSWAMLVAKICQLYPNATPETLIHKFFWIFSEWQWPLPVSIRPQYYVDQTYFKDPVWNPRINGSDRSHVMPIITPVYPQQNSNLNVSKSTLNTIQEEFKNSLHTMDAISAEESDWLKLFQPSKFFTKYDYFLAITVRANCDQDLFEWRNLVKSNLRFLPTSIEKISWVRKCQLNPEPYILPAKISQGRPSSVWFIGLEIEKSNGEAINLDFHTVIRKFNLLLKVRGKSLHRQGMDVHINHLKQKELKNYVPNELKQEMAITNAVGSKIIARLPAENNHSISEPEKLQTTSISRKRKAVDQMFGVLKKRRI